MNSAHKGGGTVVIKMCHCSGIVFLFLYYSMLLLNTCWLKRKINEALKTKAGYYVSKNHKKKVFNSALNNKVWVKKNAKT